METREELEARVYNLTLALQQRDLEVTSLRVQLRITEDKLKRICNKLRDILGALGEAYSWGAKLN
jgi:hypothetical protein